MKKKRYTIRYYDNNNPVITAISNYTELTDLLKGSAKDCFIETKISDGMPPILHNLIAGHNKNTLNPYAAVPPYKEEVDKEQLKKIADAYGEKHKKELYARNTHLSKAFIAGAKYFLESKEEVDKEEYHAVEYAGYWHIQTEPHYGGENILDAEQVGQEKAEQNAKLIAKLLNQTNGSTT